MPGCFQFNQDHKNARNVDPNEDSKSILDLIILGVIILKRKFDQAKNKWDSESDGVSTVDDDSMNSFVEKEKTTEKFQTSVAEHITISKDSSALISHGLQKSIASTANATTALALDEQEKDSVIDLSLDAIGLLEGTIKKQSEEIEKLTKRLIECRESRNPAQSNHTPFVDKLLEKAGKCAASLQDIIDKKDSEIKTLKEQLDLETTEIQDLIEGSKKVIKENESLKVELKNEFDEKILWKGRFFELHKNTQKERRTEEVNNETKGL